MEITTTLPLILALGARILLNSLVSSPDDSPPSTPDFLLTGLFQGVLLYAALTHLFVLAIPVGFGIAAKLTLDFSRTYDATQCVCTLLGVALGVVFSDVLARIFEDGTPRDGARAGAATVHVRDAPDTSRRLRLVSFGRNGQDRNRTHGHKRDAGRTHRRSGDERERPRDRDRDHDHDAQRDRDPRPLTPALTYASTSPSISLDSVPSSIDPEGRLTPREREIAVLRARASLADSERRRFKEERKWALSQGNYARASQLAWQVRRFTALMESFHREADAKVVEAARAAAPQPVTHEAERKAARRFPTAHRSQAGASTVVPFPSPTAGPAEGQPLVSVTVGTSSRRRKRSTSAAKPAIHVQGQEISVTR